MHNRRKPSFICVLFWLLTGNRVAVPEERNGTQPPLSIAARSDVSHAMQPHGLASIHKRRFPDESRHLANGQHRSRQR
jgi:hypothetical protein